MAQTKSKMILGLKSCRDRSVKIMDEHNKKCAEKNTDEGNQKNIIEENVTRISGKKVRDFEPMSRSVYWPWKIGVTISHAVGGEFNSSYPCT